MIFLTLSVFPLCNTCCKLKPSSSCNHSNEERLLRKITCVTPELYEAISVGYKVTHIYEIWSFNKLDPHVNGGLFGRYIDEAVKGKTEASGYPPDVKTESEKERYITDFHKSTGIKLDQKNIIKNPGLRFLYKLMANSLWGKFAQRNRTSSTRFLKSYQELTLLFKEAGIKINDIIFTNTSALAKISVDEALGEISSCTNVPIAAFVTSYARLRLWRLINSLGTRVLYYDTDSVVFTQKKDEWAPKVGKNLGDLTDEIREFGEGAVAKSFISTGPKSYAIKVVLPDGQIKNIIKFKGISLNDTTSKLITFDTLRNLVRDRHSFSVPVRQFAPGKMGGVNLRNTQKTVNFTFDKRLIVNKTHFNTVPWGFKHPENLFDIDLDDSEPNE